VRQPDWMRASRDLLTIAGYDADGIIVNFV
jgi:hypothetical protein